MWMTGWNAFESARVHVELRWIHLYHCVFVTFLIKLSLPLESSTLHNPLEYSWIRILYTIFVSCQQHMLLQDTFIDNDSYAAVWRFVRYCVQRSRQLPQTAYRHVTSLLLSVASLLHQKCQKNYTLERALCCFRQWRFSRGNTWIR